MSNLLYGGKKLPEITVTGELLKFESKLSLLSIFCYTKTEEVLSKKDAAFVQKLGMANSEILAHQNNIHMIIDCSELKMEKNTLFYGVNADFKRTINLQQFEMVGIQQAFESKFDLKYEVALV